MDSNKGIKHYYEIYSNNKLLTIAYMFLVISFLLPCLIQRYYVSETEKIIDTFVFYGYYNVFYYLNFLIIVLLTHFVFKYGGKKIYLVYQLIFLLFYLFIFKFSVSLPFGDSNTLPKVGLGYYVNLISTTFILVMISFKVINRN